MVKMKASDDFEQLDALVHDLCEKHNLKLYVDGWARKSYRIFTVDPASRHQDLVASLESFATQSGLITYYDDQALPFCQELGESLEKTFGIEEAVLEKKQLT